MDRKSPRRAQGAWLLRPSALHPHGCGERVYRKLQKQHGSRAIPSCEGNGIIVSENAIFLRTSITLQKIHVRIDLKPFSFQEHGDEQLVLNFEA